MRVLVGLLIAVAAMYQVCFRYEHWPSHTQEGVFFERDNLTGATRELKPGQKTDWLARLLGNGALTAGDDKDFLQDLETGTAAKPAEQGNYQMSMLETAQPVKPDREVVVASSAPPVPDAGSSGKPFSVRTVDLNLDGAREEIIQSAAGNDGLLDISIVRNGQELFFGRGVEIALMSSRGHDGWSDIVLKRGPKAFTVYRYNARQALYQEIP